MCCYNAASKRSGRSYRNQIMIFIEIAGQVDIDLAYDHL